MTKLMFASLAVVTLSSLSSVKGAASPLGNYMYETGSTTTKYSNLAYPIYKT